MTVQWYEPREPRPELASALACTWTARPSGRHRLVPDACVDLLCLLPGEDWAGPGDDLSLVLCGPEHGAWTFELPHGMVAVGVRFRPGWASLVLDLDLSSVVDRRVPYEHVVDPVEAAAVRAALAAPGSLADRADRLAQGVGSRLAAVGPADQRFVDLVTAELARSPRPSQQALAGSLGVTPRHLHRRLVHTFGYGAATIGRLLRFQRFLAVREQALASTGGPGSIAELAVAAGYADQAHLSRDCRAITGLTVRRFLAEWFPTFPDMSDPFKTGAPLAATMGR